MKKLISLILSLASLFLCLASCSDSSAQKEGYYTRTQRNETGRLSISLSRTASGEDKDDKYLDEEELKEIYNEALDVFNSAYYFISTDSESSAFNVINAPVSTVFDMDTALLSEISFAIELNGLTEGRYDPSCGTLISLVKKDSSPDSTAIEVALSHKGCDKISLSDTTLTKADTALAIDLYALADGYAISKVVDFLKESRVSYGTVTYNGIAGVFGEKPDGEPFLVDIGDGTENGRDGAFKITDGYVALVSDSFGQAFDIDDGVLEPALEKAAVYTDDARIAAVLSSIAYTYGSDALLSLYEKDGLSFEAVLTEKDMTKTYSENAMAMNLYSEETAPAESTSQE